MYHKFKEKLKNFFGCTKKNCKKVSKVCTYYIACIHESSCWGRTSSFTSSESATLLASQAILAGISYSNMAVRRARRQFTYTSTSDSLTEKLVNPWLCTVLHFKSLLVMLTELLNMLACEVIFTIFILVWKKVFRDSSKFRYFFACIFINLACKT